MKKFFSAFLGVLMLLSLFGCSEKQSLAKPLDTGLLSGAEAGIAQAEALGVRARKAETDGPDTMRMSALFSEQTNVDAGEQVITETQFVSRDVQGDLKELEFLQEGETYTLSDKDAQVTKLYTAQQGLTFFAVGIVPPEMAEYFQTVMPLVIATSQGSVSVQPRGDGRHYFARVAYELEGSTYTGYVPCRTYTGDHYYEVFNYWIDDLNRSYVLDNATGAVYDLGEYLPKPCYIQSVENGVLQLNSGEFYDVRIEKGQLVLEKIETGEMKPYTVLKDKFGHFLIDYAPFGAVKSETVNGDILAVDRNLADRGDYSLWDRYRMGSDGRIYKFVISLYPDYDGSEEELGIFYLDENMQWKPVEKGTNVDIPGLWIYDGMNRLGMSWMMSPRFGGIRNGELLVFNGFAGEFAFTHWEGSFPDNKMGMFSGVAAFSAEFPVAHTAAGEIYDSSSGAETEFIDSYILSPEAWVTLENGELRRHNVFEAESTLLADGIEEVEWQEGVLIVQGEKVQYLLCSGENAALTDSLPARPVRECLVETKL